MKKQLTALMLILLLLVAGCSSTTKEDKDAGTNEKQKDEVSKEEESEGAVAVDKGLLDVVVTVPASFFEDEDEDINDIAAEAKENGMKSAVVNDDDSITYKMSKAKHKELMTEMKNNLIEYSDDLLSDEDFTSIKDITYTKKFTEFTIVVEKEAFENSFDGFAVFGLGMSGIYYQLFDGVNPEKLNVTIHTVDESTGEKIGTMNFPEDLEDLDELDDLDTD